MKRALLAAIPALLMLCCSAPREALADIMNTRPVVISAPSVGAEKKLQSFLDKTDSTINVDTDQSPWAFFTPGSGGSATLTLRLEETVFDNTLGIYQFGDPSFMIPVLLADGTPGKVGFFSDVVFNADGIAGRVRVNRFGGKGDPTTSVTLDGFGTVFGFYIQHPAADVTRTFFSEDSLTSDAKAHFLAFARNGTETGAWYFGFEDSFNHAIDNDYNDYFLSATGLEPVTAVPPAGIPEPASMMLLGAGLLGFRSLGKRRLKR